MCESASSERGRGGGVDKMKGTEYVKYISICEWMECATGDCVGDMHLPKFDLTMRQSRRKECIARCVNYKGHISSVNETR
jgi:hypothetical protein